MTINEFGRPVLYIMHPPGVPHYCGSHSMVHVLPLLIAPQTGTISKCISENVKEAFKKDEERAMLFADIRNMRNCCFFEERKDIFHRDDFCVFSETSKVR